MLKAEQRLSREASVAARLWELLGWRYADRQPDAFHTAGLHRELLIDRRSGVLWTLAYNGADGDDWRQSTWGSWIATGHPLTPDRERLVDDLTDLYASDDDWRHQGVAADGQRALLEAGWTLPTLRQRLQTIEPHYGGTGRVPVLPRLRLRGVRIRSWSWPPLRPAGSVLNHDGVIRRPS